MTSGSDVSLWNPIITAFPWFLSTCAPLLSSLLLSYFLSTSRIFSSISVNLSLICLYLSSHSSFIFTMAEFIPCNCAPTEAEIFCRNFSIYSSFFFAADLLGASNNSFSKNNASSLGLVSLPSLTSANFLFCLYLLLIPVRPLTHSHPSLPVGLRDISIVVSVTMLFSSIVLFFFVQHFPMMHEICHASRDRRSSLDFIQ